MNARLAIVDDDPDFTEFLATLLRAQTYDVDVYHSGTELLDALRRGQTPQVILLDVLMPNLDGLDTLRAIRQAQPAAQVIMLSGRHAPATVIEAVRLGAADYVLKPGDAEGMGEAALEAAIRNALQREALSSEVARLSAQVAEDPEGTQPCWSIGAEMQSVMDMVDRVADSSVDVLLRGESGTGKEVIARELHRRSSRRTKPFVKVNCAALPADLLESELFGHERGAFTGAGTTRIGKFEFADGGTIMLDEIGEMPIGLQAKILHVLQDRQFTKLGSNRPIDVDVRVIAATNRDLDSMMRERTFREDLYYRLQVIELRIPPLRQRRNEIPALIEFFLLRYARLYRRPAPRPSQLLLEALADYSWPGNIRELENTMKRFVVLQDERMILTELSRPRHAAPQEPAAPVAAPHAAFAQPVAAPAPAPAAPPLALVAEPEDDVVEVLEDGDGQVDLQALAKAAALQAQRKAIDQALARFRWNRRKAAAYLSVSYKTLLNKMKECGISEAPPS
ncbi:MAG: sigma-54-dependent Fis family transcriptional regulator [Acidobacteria bacterium]|jgi:two-component system response regulator AtoC|nr:sigma-54-dependent Fis family transcriptional regulator [Acidobacteriota bacterium]